MAAARLLSILLVLAASLFLFLTPQVRAIDDPRDAEDDLPSDWRVFMEGRRVEKDASSIENRKQLLLSKMESGELDETTGKKMIEKLEARRERAVGRREDRLERGINDGRVDRAKGEAMLKDLKENNPATWGRDGSREFRRPDKKKLTPEQVAEQEKRIQDRIDKGEVPKERGQKMIKLLKQRHGGEIGIHEES